jgi:branched-chain amino acid transport system substrate-binding protein
MNVGILFPSSTTHANIGFDFMNGLKTFLKENNLETQIAITSESIGIGGTEKEVYAKAEKLLMIDGVDILLAYIDERVLPLLKPLVYAAGKLMIVVNPGANYPVNWVPQSNIVHLTLQHAFCCWLTGSLAAKEENKNAATVTTFYDCGYLHAASMMKSFAKNGGKVMFNYVNKDKYDDTFNIDPLVTFLESDKNTNNILCIFDSMPASLFFGLLNKKEANEKLELFVSPMMLEQKALENIGDGFSFSVNGYLPWKASAENEHNENFIDVYRKKNKKDPSFFSLLGWESAMLLQQVIQTAGDDYTDGTVLADGLKEMSFNSPRGPLKLDAETHHFLAPVGKCSIKERTSDMEIEWEGDYSKEWRSFVDEPSGGVISGWTNTYLCY